MISICVLKVFSLYVLQMVGLDVLQVLGPDVLQVLILDVVLSHDVLHWFHQRRKYTNLHTESLYTSFLPID